MSIETKLIDIADNLYYVFDAGYKKAENESKALYYLSFKDFQWYKVVFPENYNFILKTAKTPQTCNALLSNSTNVVTVKLECEEKNGTAIMSQAFREMPHLKRIDLTNFNLKFNDISYFIYSSEAITSILGAIDLLECASTTGAFTNAFSLEDIEFAPKSIKTNIDLHWSKNLTHTSLLSILNGLYDYNVNISFLNCRPDFAKQGEATPGIYKITKVNLTTTNSNIEIDMTTEDDYHFRIAKSDCGNSWNAILDAAIVGNYIEFDGAYNSNNVMEFDVLNICANPYNTNFTLNIGSENLEKLSDEEKQIATNKGWVLK